MTIAHFYADRAVFDLLAELPCMEAAAFRRTLDAVRDPNRILQLCAAKRRALREGDTR